MYFFYQQGFFLYTVIYNPTILCYPEEDGLRFEPDSTQVSSSCH